MSIAFKEHPLHQQIEAVLRHYPALEQPQWAPLAGGLINHTFAVEAAGQRFILQRLNPIFDARLHVNIEAVTAHLAAHGQVTPRLLRTCAGELYHRHESNPGERHAWRVLTRIAGSTHHRVNSVHQARAAGVLVGQFHRAMSGLQHRFEGVRVGVHDTAAHLQTLRAAMQQHEQHPLFAEVQELAKTLLSVAANLQPLPPLPDIVGHGDLKISNLLFAETGPARAICLVDLDTLAPMQLAHELGDAWRSWCNPNREGGAEVHFDCALFEASYAGYVAGKGRGASVDEQVALLLGPELISLELAVRFCADALNESYFGWDQTQYKRAGTHNLARARGQYALHCATVGTRDQRRQILATT